jgi:hypothetical protein
VAQRKVAQLLEDAIQLVQQVALPGKHAPTHEVLDIVPQRAAALERLELVAVLVAGDQVVQCFEQPLLVIQLQPPGKPLDGSTSLPFHGIRIEAIFARQGGRQFLQGLLEGLARIRCPLPLASLSDEASQAMLVDPAVVVADTLADQRAKLFLQAVGRLAAQ